MIYQTHIFYSFGLRSPGLHPHGADSHTVSLANMPLSYVESHMSRVHRCKKNIRSVTNWIDWLPLFAMM